MNLTNTLITNSLWQFWIDRGGTFTDIVAKAPDGKIIIHKLLSENPDRYPDAPVQGIREILGISQNEPIPSTQIEVIKMGTTVATNALLERKGDRTVLVITKGFKDALRIGYQNRPNIFARQIILPEMLYEKVIEVEERYTAKGEEIIPLQTTELISQFETVYKEGIRSCAIVLMHGYRYPKHEQKIKEIAQEIGFTQVSVSHEVSPLMKLVSRGDTTVVDAYLSPILRRYVNQVSNSLGFFDKSGKEKISPQQNSTESTFEKEEIEGEVGEGTDNQTDLTLTFQKGLLNSRNISERQPVKLMFMQSNGGLTDAQKFQGKDSILSGPAGGIVGAVQTSKMAGFHKIISFDMGGTSTDVAHYAGAVDKTIEYEREFETEIAGVRLRTPIMSIHTVAAGGGSILFFDGARYRVGPESAGANPGPAAYGKGGPLTVTDCNVMVGKIQPEFFPKVFGKEGNLPLNLEIVQEKFTQLAAEIGNSKKPEEVANGYLAIAVEKMANAIKKISLQKGYDVSEYTLCCFGGAGGQHACLIADALGMKQIFIHPYAGVLSAYGMGLADIRVMKEKAVEKILTSELLSELKEIFTKLEIEAKQELITENYSSENSDLESTFDKQDTAVTSLSETEAKQELISENFSSENQDLESTTDLISERNNFDKQDTAVTSLSETEAKQELISENFSSENQDLESTTDLISERNNFDKQDASVISLSETEAKQELISENFSSENQDLESTTDLISERNNFDKQDASVTSLLSKVHLKYQGSDSTLIIDFSENISTMKAEFETAHQQRYGFIMAEKSLIVEAVSLELIQQMETPEETEKSPTKKSPTTPVTTTQIYTAGKWHDTPIYLRENLQPGDKINSPALIIEKTGTNIIEPGWQAELTTKNHLILTRSKTSETKTELTSKSPEKNSTSADPVMLEIFNNLFRAIAEQMGITLQNTSSSVNIKERLDFSCAIFDKYGQLVANAPHIPIHLGSMSESVNAVISEKGDTLKPGDVYVLNNPYNGGTHLPDITVITPVFPTLQKPKDCSFIANQDLQKKNNNTFPENNSTDEIFSDTNIGLDDKFITQKWKSANLHSNANLISQNQTNICLQTNSTDETFLDTNIGLDDKFITQKWKSANLHSNANLISQNQTNICLQTNSTDETFLDTNIGLDDKFITQKWKSANLHSNANLISQNQTNFLLNTFPENNSNEETLSNTNIGLGDKSITQKWKSPNLPSNENLISQNQTNIFPETNSTDETLSNTTLGLGDKSITQKWKSANLPSNANSISQNQTNTFPETNSTDETLSNTTLGLGDKSITQKWKSANLPSNANSISQN
uniref:hydantoinase/oxoprolinase family protein n=1 Tax=Okeania sp. SIO2F4 TaxID=2607790 RepID=UPI0025DD505E